MGRTYNYCLDFIKGLACMFVVFMHCEFPGKLGIVVQAISRFSVPLFFMVSGFFCFQSDGKSIKNKISHILKIILYASLLSLSYVIFQSFFWGDVNWNITLYRLYKFFIFNVPPIIVGQYWFLFALLYVYIMYAVVEKFKLHKYAYSFAAILFFIYIFMAQGLHLAGVIVPNMYYRNFLIEGFPYFMLGHWIHANYKNIEISNRTLILLIAFTTFLCLPERWLLGRDFGVNIATLPQVFCLMLYAVKNPLKYEGVIQTIGKRYSMYVYILHPIIWRLLRQLYNIYGLSDNTPALYVMPVLVLVSSLILSHFVYILNSGSVKKIKQTYA